MWCGGRLETIFRFGDFAKAVFYSNELWNGFCSATEGSFHFTNTNSHEETNEEVIVTASIISKAKNESETYIF